MDKSKQMSHIAHLMVMHFRNTFECFLHVNSALITCAYIYCKRFLWLTKIMFGFVPFLILIVSRLFSTTDGNKQTSCRLVKIIGLLDCVNRGLREVYR